MIFVLDTSPLGLATNPSDRNKEVFEFNQWLKRVIKNRHIIAVPEICYYEVRRELIRCKKGESVIRLDEFVDFDKTKIITYIPISKEIIVKASQLWAWARNTGQQTAHDEALDGDVILAATAITVAHENSIEVLIVTNNAEHIERYTPAKHWREIII